jgi:hypothetical protein
MKNDLLITGVRINMHTKIAQNKLLRQAKYFLQNVVIRMPVYTFPKLQVGGSCGIGNWP